MAVLLLAPAIADAGANVGHTSAALPGLLRVSTAHEAETGLSVALSGGYGYTEGVLGIDDAHHRALGTVAVGFQPFSWLGASLKLDGRIDRHSGGTGDGGGLAGDPRLFLRGSWDFDLIGAGVQIVGWFPGKKAPSIDFGATSFDFLLLGSLKVPELPLLLAANAGFRLDRSANAAPDADILSPEDRLALGVSESNAVLLGFGLSYRIDAVELLADWTWSVLVGDLAPPPAASPMLLSGGARWSITDDEAFQLTAMLQVAPAGRPIVDPIYPLVPVDPLVSGIVGLNYRPPVASAPVHRAPPPPPPPPPIAPPPPQPTTGTFLGRVTNTDGAPLLGARVTVETATGSRTVVATDGSFELERLPVGSVRVRIEADGYDSLELSVRISPAGNELEVSLKPALPSGQLKGIVRSSRGSPLPAKIKIDPLGLELTADADGGFEVSLPPGAYWVSVEMPGYRRQRKRVKVARDDVVVLNLELKGR